MPLQTSATSIHNPKENGKNITRSNSPRSQMVGNKGNASGDKELQT